MNKSLIALALLAVSVAAWAAVNPNVRAVQPDQVSGYWLRTNTSLTVDVPNSGFGLERPTCSAVTYLIGSDGMTHDVVVRKTVPAGDLARVAASAVQDLRYVPSDSNNAREPIFTYIVIPFNLPADPAARKKITRACTLRNFPDAYR